MSSIRCQERDFCRRRLARRKSFERLAQAFALVMRSSVENRKTRKLRLVISGKLLLTNKASSLAVPSRLAVTYRAVGDLIPDPRNARTHPKRQVASAFAGAAAT
jgi:hypothetical protein